MTLQPDDIQEFDYSLLFNAVAAQDAKGVVRAIRPFMSMFQDLMLDVSPEDRGTEEFLTPMRNLTKVMMDTLDALPEGEIRGSVAAYILYNFNKVLAPDIIDRIKEMAAPEDQQPALVTDGRFHTALAAFHASGDADKSRLEQQLYLAADRVDPSEKFDAFMSAAYTIEDKEYIKKAVIAARNAFDAMPVQGEDFDTAYYAAFEMYHACPNGRTKTDIGQVVTASQKQKESRGHRSMDRQTYLARLTPVS